MVESTQLAKELLHVNVSDKQKLTFRIYWISYSLHKAETSCQNNWIRGGHRLGKTWGTKEVKESVVALCVRVMTESERPVSFLKAAQTVQPLTVPLYFGAKKLPTCQLPAQQRIQSCLLAAPEPLWSVYWGQKEEFRGQQQLSSLADLYTGCMIPEQLSEGREEMDGEWGNKLVIWISL